MTKQSDTSAVSSQSTASVQPLLTDAERDERLYAISDALADPQTGTTERSRLRDELRQLVKLQTVEDLAAAGIPPNPAPAIEEGPHLDDPEVRRLKRRQLKDAGLTGDEDHLTDDLKTILSEEG